MPELPAMPAKTACLPRDFRWGVATSAYQIEGAARACGRTASIWDTFCRTPGAVAGAETGEVACDHYHRMPQDVALMAELGIGTYRFSVSWPRVQPAGLGRVNLRGMSFYDRLVDTLLGAGIDPWITLYHWDLPQELEDAGGWPRRDTAYRFADYAELVYDALGDRAQFWTTLNEPWCIATYGYADGIHAPGRHDRRAAMHAVHHLLLGHGEAIARMRERARPGTKLGITLNLTPVHPASDSPADAEAARRADGTAIRMYLDPLLRGRYPGDVLQDLEREGIELPAADGDLATISAPLDLLGVNYYFDETIRADGAVVRGENVTGLGWPVTPHGLTELLLRLDREYPPIPVYLTENGASFPDAHIRDGCVADVDRITYLRSHIDAVAAAYQAGCDVRGYFTWTLLDNFEWAHGYAPRFGLVHVDRATQARTLKLSAHWYQTFLRANKDASADFAGQP